MVYFALPVRDSAVHLLCNAAPGLPRRSRVSRTPSRSFLDCTLAKPNVLLQSRERIPDCLWIGTRLLAGNVALLRVFAASAEGNVAVEEPATATGESLAEDHAENTSNAVSDVQPMESASDDPPPQPVQQRRLTRSNSTAGAKKAKVITVPKEQLIQGAVFTGKVRAVQSYGAFVDIGAFTDGLVHISQLSSNYVRQVQDVVTIGQEVTVRVIDVDETAGRIGLTMRDKEAEDQQKQTPKENDSEGGSKSQQGEGGKVMNRGKIAGRGSSARGKRDEQQKVTKLQKGQELEGKVKNIIRSGAFVEFLDGEEGFLRGSEIAVGGENVPVESLLHVGQEVKVRVLKIERGKVNLTMNPEVDMKSLNRSINKNEDAGASNPFELAFRMANLIGNDTQVASKESSMETSGLPEEQASAETGEATEAVEDKIPEQQPVAEFGKATETVEDKILEQQPVAELGEVTETVEHKIPEQQPVAEIEEATETVEDKIPEQQPVAEIAEATETVEDKIPEQQPIAELGEAIETLEDKIPEQQAVAEPVEATKLADMVTEDKLDAAVIPDEEPVAELGDTKKEHVDAAEDKISAEPNEATKEIDSVPDLNVEAATIQDQPPLADVDPAVQLHEAVDDQLAAELVEAVQDLEKTAELVAEEITIENKLDAEVEEKQKEEASAPVNPEEDLKPVAEAEANEEVSPSLAPEEQVPDIVAGNPGAEADETLSIPESEEPSPSIPGAFALETDSMTTTAASDPVMDSERSPPTETVSEVKPESPPLTELVGESESPAPQSVTEVEPAIAHVTESVVETPVAEQPSTTKTSANAPTAAQVKEIREMTGAGMMECKKALVACESDVAKASEYLRKKGLASAEKKASRIAAEGLVGSYVHDGRIGVLVEVNCETDFVARGEQFKELVADMGMQVVACPAVDVVTVEDVPAEFVAKEKAIESEKDDLAKKPPQIREKIVEGRVAKRLAELALLEQPYIRDDKILVKDLVTQTIAGLGEKVQIRRFVRYNLGEGLQKKSTDFAAEVAAQTAATIEAKPAVPAPEVKEEKTEDTTPKVAVSAARVKELREATGAGMMDCKKALAACENNVEKATEFLRKKGLASAEKKAGKVASEGLIGSYIHDGRIGVLIEVNSETDFVARSEAFKELVTDLAMQVVACPQVQYVSVEDIPKAVVEKEMEIELGKEDLASKPEAIRGKIVEGRVAKMMAELALLEQPYIRNDKILVKDLVKQTVATLGENIQVRRFTRFNLGEGIEKRSVDFAAEVAAQTGASA